FVGNDVLGGDGIDVFPYVSDKLPLCSRLVIIGRRFQDALEIFQWKLRIHRNQRTPELDHRVDLLAATEAVLGRKMLGRKDLPQLLLDDLGAAFEHLSELNSELTDLLLHQ